jgi:hypothetical protein
MGVSHPKAGRDKGHNREVTGATFWSAPGAGIAGPGGCGNLDFAATGTPRGDREEANGGEGGNE